MMTIKNLLIVVITMLLCSACSDTDEYTTIDTNTTTALQDTFGTAINLDALANYANQNTPNYITKDNTANNPITDAKATLGRVLFYDKNLSTTNDVSCASCHQQAHAFGDTDAVSIGVNGVTARHSMRLINTRFARETRFFWDERANTLEAQTTQPIQDHTEMGFSGTAGAPSLNDLLTKLAALTYYQELFQFVYGDTIITETRLQECLAQFVRSIQSFDAKYDIGRAQVNTDTMDFPNFTTQENTGKSLFFRPPNQNGAGCITCHAAPEFDIDPASLNNGIIGVFGTTTTTDITVTRAPTLRDIFDPLGTLNGALMHDASRTSFIDVLHHYNAIDATGNTNLDNRLRGGNGANGQNLALSTTDMEAIEAFIKTLSGTNVYTDTKWSDPFLD